MNGTEFGPIANHSLVMASYISRANAAVIDLRDILLIVIGTGLVVDAITDLTS